MTTTKSTTAKLTASTSQQALWFLIVGASAALVHFLVLVSIVSLTTTTPTWANVIAFLLAFVVSFFGHFYLTFRQSPSPYGHSDNSNEQNFHVPSWRNSLPTLIKWFTSSAVGFAANQSLFVLGLNWFGERYYILIWIVVTGIITVMTFSLGKLWAFKS
ncbi:GtrA family protein [Psychrobacter sp. AOP22-C1-C5]|uniref:GtrA family protein n=1 Tax=Psychrobacter sp. AOP22-C1-C5 TaxID=3457716 RepID=UPI004035A613